MQRNGILNYFGSAPAASACSAEFKPPRIAGSRAAPTARASGMIPFPDSKNYNRIFVSALPSDIIIRFLLSMQLWLAEAQKYVDHKTGTMIIKSLLIICRHPTGRAATAR